ncbi:ATP-binding protein [Endozoicomonas euniceicola]|uniref:histidine kinase n=1 Tax=Endozoicomonas euniceicola TaxID=1234143 RepID=A0ABY6GQZ2_9GAMM|nr:ATP-binding protein [Endozoicomonas euniceicola]UYM14987.1 ATP-binding protein [Endozoicomonas euniceicola]
MSDFVDVGTGAKVRSKTARKYWGRLSSLSRTLLPDSLPGRFFMFMLLLVFASQLVISSVWNFQSWTTQEKALENVVSNMAVRVLSTIEYFDSLPDRYRHIILDQLRDMGGTRYFVTLNRDFIEIDELPGTRSQDIVINGFKDTLGAFQANGTFSNDAISIAFSAPETLRVFNNNTYLMELTESWGQHTLIVEPLSLPVLVIQVPVSDNEWLYLATLMPDSGIMSSSLPMDLQVIYLFGLTVLLMFGSWMIYVLTQPVEQLSKAAENFGRSFEPVYLPEEGAREFKTTASAFNRMQRNIQHFLNDRKQLFSGISHDLKTPLTRLRLRAEMLDDDDERQGFVEDIEHLDMMVRSALQMVRDTDIHENPESVDLEQMLENIARAGRSVGQKISVKCHEHEVVTGKPLALRRCFENLIDNAVIYGGSADISLSVEDGYNRIVIRDQGPGLPGGMEEEVFQPYRRFEHGEACNPGGNGLGLITARHLVGTHGGQLSLRNHPQGGLEVTLTIPCDI